MKRPADIVREHFQSHPPELVRVVAMVAAAQRDAVFDTEVRLGAENTQLRADNAALRAAFHQRENDADVALEWALIDSNQELSA